MHVERARSVRGDLQNPWLLVVRVGKVAKTKLIKKNSSTGDADVFLKNKMTKEII